MNKVLEQDILNLSSQHQYFEDFENSSVLVTGATGLIGSIIVKALLKHGKIKVFANCRSQEKFEKIFSSYKTENLTPLFSDILSLNIKDIEIDYIIHGASVTDSKTFIEKPVETIDIALDGTRNLLRQCIGKSIKGFVYLSSLEVYGTFKDCNEIKNVKESDSGYIDTMSVRSSYSEGKRMVETMITAYASEYNMPLKVVRLCQTFGAGVEYNDNRVFAQFARNIIESKDIVLKTKGETVRNYCYTTDAVSGILTVLSKGEKGQVYNIANKDTTISIVGMAEKFCNLYPGCTSKVVFDLSNDATKLGYNPVVKLELNTEKLESLGWKAEIDFNQMITRLVEVMKNEKSN